MVDSCIAFNFSCTLALGRNAAKVTFKPSWDGIKLSMKFLSLNFETHPEVNCESRTSDLGISCLLVKNYLVDDYKA